MDIHTVKKVFMAKQTPVPALAKQKNAAPSKPVSASVNLQVSVSQPSCLVNIEQLNTCQDAEITQPRPKPKPRTNQNATPSKPTLVPINHVSVSWLSIVVL